jgi:hypothetical protein
MLLSPFQEIKLMKLSYKINLRFIHYVFTIERKWRGYIYKGSLHSLLIVLLVMDFKAMLKN